MSEIDEITPQEPELPAAETDEAPEWEPTGEVAEEVRAEIMAKLEELKKEFGASKVTELMVDVALDEEVAAFLLDAEPTLRSWLKNFGGKIRFVMHREPNGDYYVLRNLLPREWKTQWLEILTGREDIFAKYCDEILKICMVFPTFENTDWDYDGLPKMNAPIGLTKSRLVGAFLQSELPADPNQPTSVAFNGAALDDASTVARRHKPSL